MNYQLERMMNEDVRTILIRGPIGSGKTTLLSELEEEAGKLYKVFRLDGDVKYGDRGDYVDEFCVNIEREIENRLESLRDAVGNYKKYKLKDRIYIIIDDVGDVMQDIAKLVRWVVKLTKPLNIVIAIATHNKVSVESALKEDDIDLKVYLGDSLVSVEGSCAEMVIRRGIGLFIGKGGNEVINLRERPADDYRRIENYKGEYDVSIKDEILRERNSTDSL